MKVAPRTPLKRQREKADLACSGQQPLAHPLLHSRPSGFALVIVLAILAMILILILSISSVLHVETRTSASGKNLLLARQNALLGLDTAIAQLQEYAGKDQAITFPATTYYPTKNVSNGSGPIFDDPNFGYRSKAATAPRKTFLTPTERTNWDNALKQWWNDNRNPRWTGIADASLRRDGTSPDKYGEPKRDQLPVWLVSGNEKFTISGNTTSYPPGYLTPDTPLPDPAGNSTVVWLVGNGSVSNAAQTTDRMEPRVKVRKVEVKTTANGTATGHYAYWVGDESLKANFAVLDPFANPDGSPKPGMGIGTPDYRNRLQVPQRIGWENISISGTGNATFLSLPPSFGVNDPNLENITTSKEIALLETANGTVSSTQAVQNATKNNFHSLTAWSRSLLTDTALGGLKKDLTVFFEGSGSGINLNDPVPDRSLYDPNDPRFGGSSNNGFPRTTATTGLPTWKQLKDWYDNNQGEMGPVLANYQIFYAFTHKDGKIQFHLIPYFALWNPYNTTLSGSYELKLRQNFRIQRAAQNSSGLGFAVENKEYTDPTPGDSDSDDADGRKIGNWYISKLRSVPGWFSRSDKFPSSQSRRLSTDAMASQNNLWQGTSTTGSADYAWSPFDLGANLPVSQKPGDNPNATWVSYNFNASFEPGEVKVFTIGNSQSVDPQELHTGNQSIQLVNDFEPDFPKSAYFDFAEGLEKQPGQAPGAGDIVRWIGSLGPEGNIPTTSMQLLRSGKEIWLCETTGSTDPRRWFVGDNNNKNDPSTWKRVYHLDEWPNPSQSGQTNVGGFTPNINANYIPFISSRFSPLIGDPHSYDATNGFTQAGINKVHRVFAISNMAAPIFDLIKEIDYARAKDSTNNPDRFSRREIFEATENFKPVKWDDNQVDASTNRGFALFSWQSTNDSRKTKGLSQLPVRLNRANFNLISLGQLQQANLSNYFWQPGFAIGNSEASPYVDRARAAGLQSYDIARSTESRWMVIQQPELQGVKRPEPNDAKNRFLDFSFTINEALWDRYFLSTVPQSGPLATDNSTPLPNGRHKFVGNPSASDVRDFNTASAYLENRAALNVNSTSVEAWKSLLTAFRGLIIEADGEKNPGPPTPTVPVSRNLTPLSGPVNFVKPDGSTVKSDYGAVAENRDYSKMFKGFRYLTDKQIQALAERIVDEIRLRGPFYSLSDFVNRRLVPPDSSSNYWLEARTKNKTEKTSSYDTSHEVPRSYDSLAGLAGINGALQRAINVSGINGGANYPLANRDNDRVFAVDMNPALSTNTNYTMQQYPMAAYYLDTEHLTGVPVGEVGQLFSHSPGFITQGDILAMIGPALTPRGDTFLIRTYGDAVDKNGRVLARAYLEAVVQRVAEPVKPKGTSGLDKWTPTNKFGRKFKVVSLRWLNPEEV